ncbi:hypothetical protein LLS1_37560 [Leifsonia sp. LS1]|nr:hypothetical protein LLS1_37560 [Leifsonia sp. LS1]
MNFRYPDAPELPDSAIGQFWDCWVYKNGQNCQPYQNDQRVQTRQGKKELPDLPDVPDSAIW